jgi:hypothetical protein
VSHRGPPLDQLEQLGIHWAGMSMMAICTDVVCQRLFS